jgi:hypothetical protein
VHAHRRLTHVNGSSIEALDDSVSDAFPATLPGWRSSMEAHLRRFVVTLLGAERDMTFVTVRPDGHPQATIVPYANDGLDVYFGTYRNSHAVRNLEHSDKTSITVASPHADWGEVRALSMGGRSRVLAAGSGPYQRGLQLLRAKVPEVADLLVRERPSIAVVCFSPVTIVVLDHREALGYNELVEVLATDG